MPQKLELLIFFGNFFCGVSINLVARWGQLAHFKEKEENFSRFGNFDKKRENCGKKYIIWRKETNLQCVWQLLGNENSNKVFGWLREKIAARLRT